MRVSICRHMHCIIWFSLLAVSFSIQAATVTIAGDEVNVRSGPGRTYDVIDVVARDEKFEILEEQSDWYRISVEGRVGWISAKSTSTHAPESLEELIARADGYFRQRQFTTPADANAFDVYQDVLRQNPDHSHARRRIEEMAGIYKNWSELAAQRGDDDTARIYHERYLFVAPDASVQEDSPGTPTSATASQPLRMYRLRSAPAEVSADSLRQMIQTDHFHHPADWSKYDLSGSVTGTIRHDYEQLLAADGVTVIADYATNLIWQHSSPSTPLTWNEAHAYIQQLNSRHYGGYADWRLPTIEELASLLEPAKSSRHLYLDPIFGTTQLWCWSADPVALADGHAWYVSFSSGGMQPHEMQASAFVLAVRTLQ